VHLGARLKESNLLSFHSDVVVSCIVVLAAIIALTGDTPAAARDSHSAIAVKARTHQAHDARSVPSKATHGTRRAAHDTPDGAAHNGARESGYSFSGVASYYSERRTGTFARAYKASGNTCAHRTLPFGTQLRVTDPRSGRSVVVTVNDRGPFVRRRVLDLSLSAAQAIGMIRRGVMQITAVVL
jgi:peptidoglycan lytic transglycosylase